ncbi:MAG: glycosyltransferase family 39 protein [Candidatus Margulisbacteria bacterium]|nr:glycosyltransferase family 39 protein [Candidatus Margulisiibacteriota bacterium]
MKLKTENLKLKTNVLTILIALSAILFFFKLGSFSLYDAAETTYGEFIKQIGLTGDWLTLHYNGEIIFDKPPLYYWLATMATFIFGFNEFAIRFWAAISGILTVITTFYLGKHFYNERVGFYSGLIVMTAFQFLIQSRIAELDTLLTLLLSSTFLFFWLGFHEKKPYFYWLFYAVMALAVITKGIIGLALPGFAILLFLFLKKELNRIYEMQIPAGILIVALIGAPWYIAEWLMHGDKFTEFVLGFLFMSRFKGVVAGHPGPWYYYFLAIILGFAPWSHFLPYSLIRTWKHKLKAPELLSLCYIIPVFIVFSVAKTKLPSYILPLYPFFAIMVGKLWYDFLGHDREAMRKGMLIANSLLAVVVILIIIGFIMLGTSNYAGQYQELLPNLQLLAGVLVAGSLISIGSFIFHKYKISFTALPVMVFIITFILTMQTLPAVEQYKGSKVLGNKIEQVILPGQIITAYNTGNRPSVVLYNSQPVEFLTNENEFISFLRLKNGYCITTIEEYDKLKIKVDVLAKKGDLIVIY